VALTDAATLSVADGDGVWLRDGSGVRLGVVVPVAVRTGVRDSDVGGVPVVLDDGVPVIEGVSVADGVCEALPEPDAVADADAPADNVPVPVTVTEPVSDDVGVPVCDADGVPVCVRVPLALARSVRDGEKDGRPVLLPVGVVLGVRVGVGVSDGVGVVLGDGVPVRVGVSVVDGVCAALLEPDAVVDADAPTVPEPVLLTVTEPVPDDVGAPVALAVSERVADGDRVALRVRLGLGVPAALGLGGAYAYVRLKGGAPLRPPNAPTSTHHSRWSTPATTATDPRPHPGASSLPAAHAKLAALSAQPRPTASTESNAAAHALTVSTPPSGASAGSAMRSGALR
jgi:hypothetical protein